MENQWNSTVAQELNGLDLLVYRSNLLGADRRICNWGGGNTSWKTQQADFRGRVRPVIWVKGSGSDLATIDAKGFVGLWLDDIEPLLELDSLADAAMVQYLSMCHVQPGQPRHSIETLLHAFLPFAHIDHTHSDASIMFACSAAGEKLLKERWSDRAVWVDYHRPGFTLAKRVAQAVRANPQAEAVVLAKHGLITWGDTAEQSYTNMLRFLNDAYAVVEEYQDGRKVLGETVRPPLPENERHELVRDILPTVRGILSEHKRTLVAYDDAPALLNFLAAEKSRELTQIGAACPDHIILTKFLPLWVDYQPGGGSDKLKTDLRTALQTYAQNYRAYWENDRAKVDAETQAAAEPMDDPFPRIILIPGIGMLSTGRDRRMARISGDLYHRAIAVMEGASTLDRFISLTPTEAFAVEYWPLERYKLSLAPAESLLSRQVALVTGAAGGIGGAICQRLLADGASVVVADINFAGAEESATAFNKQWGSERALAVQMDVTDETSVREGFRQAIEHFGGLDIVVNNAGLATSRPVTETSLAEWNKNMAVLGTGYFLVAREAFRILTEQKLGGSLVFIGSKNSIAAGKNASAYSAAKAAELHLARCLAEEGGAHGIRVNSVLPDAVLQGSQIWNGNWRAERATAYGIEPHQLEEYYRQRTTLKVNVLPDDIAEAVAFFASSRSAKTTGGVLTVDGGVPTAYVR